LVEKIGHSESDKFKVESRRSKWTQGVTSCDFKNHGS
jgi:hypothetical protein